MNVFRFPFFDVFGFGGRFGLGVFDRDVFALVVLKDRSYILRFIYPNS
jgi:hypothetical protein